MTAMHIFGVCNYAWTWYHPDGAKSVEDIAAQFATGLLHGLTAKRPSRRWMDATISSTCETVRRAPDRLPHTGAITSKR